MTYYFRPVADPSGLQRPGDSPPPMTSPPPRLTGVVTPRPRRGSVSPAAALDRKAASPRSPPVTTALAALRIGDPVPRGAIAGPPLPPWPPPSLMSGPRVKGEATALHVAAALGSVSQLDAALAAGVALHAFDPSGNQVPASSM